MNIKVTPGKFLIYCLLLSGLTYIIVSSFAGYLALNVDWTYVYGIAVGVNLILYFIYIYPIGAASAGILGGIFMAAGYFFSKDKLTVFIEDNWNILRGCFLWFMEYLYKPIEVKDLYARIVIAAFVITIAIIYFVLVIQRGYVVFSMICGLIIISVMWVTGYTGSFDAMKSYLFLSLILYGFSNYGFLENKWRLRRDNYPKKTSLVWASCTLVVLMMVSTAASYLPGDIEPLNKSWIDSMKSWTVWNNWFNSGTEVTVGRPEGTPNTSYVGFQGEPSKLGGSVKLSNTLMLKVKVEGDAGAPIYLRGSIKDHYTGSRWVKEFYNTVKLENGGKISVLWGNGDKVKKVKKVDITVYPQSISTAYLFNLWKPVSVEIDGIEYYGDSDGEIYADIFINKKYKVSSEVPIVNSDELRLAKNITETTYVDNYLQLPHNLPDRVRSLALKITDDYSNNYDKALAIQNYLRENFPYTLETSLVPEESDFVDYFLFEEKKGYCTYFASAMAVMCRAVGIPSRYVEGMVVKNSDLDDLGLYNVMSNSAHAWVEVYFDGYGWVKFEPTPAYEEAGYLETQAGKEESDAKDKTRPVESGVEGSGHKEDSLQDQWERAMEPRKYLVPLTVIGTILFTLCLRAAVKVHVYRWRLKKAESLKDKDAAVEYLSILEGRLKRGGIVRASNETPSEFGNRVHEILSPYNIDIKKTMNYFQSVRFGNNKMNSNAKESFKSAIRASERFVKDRVGPIKYLMFKYFI